MSRGVVGRKVRRQDLRCAARNTPRYCSGSHSSGENAMGHDIVYCYYIMLSRALWLAFPGRMC